MIRVLQKLQMKKINITINGIDRMSEQHKEYIIY